MKLRRLTRFSTRILPGGRRPSKLDDLAIICRIFEELIQSGIRLRRYYAEMDRENARYKFEKELDDALTRVYGPSPDSKPVPLPGSQPFTKEQEIQYAKDEKARLKVKLFLARVEAQSARTRRFTPSKSLARLLFGKEGDSTRTIKDWCDGLLKQIETLCGELPRRPLSETPNPLHPAAPPFEPSQSAA